jgi:hypothetical protein
MKKPTCETCFYWEKSGESCRKSPPIILDNGDCFEWGMQPHTTSKNWCGEHPDFEDWIKYNKEKK